MSISPAFVPGQSQLTGPIHDVVVICGGWGQSFRGEGAQLTAGSTTGNRQLLGMLQRIRRPANHELKLLGLTGSVYRPGETIHPALAFIGRHFDPRGKLIVYGFSAGGLNAMEVCRQLPSFYSYRQQRLVSASVDAGPPTMTQRAPTGPRNPEAIVDCLFTIDAAAGVVLQSGRRVNRQVPSDVRLNVNYYQTNSGTLLSTHSYGGQNTPLNRGRTTVENINMTGRANHDTIDDVTNPLVSARIEAILNG